MALHLVSNVSDVWIDRLVIETTSVPLPRKNIPAGSKETFCCPPKKKHSRWEYRNVLLPTQEKTFPLEVQKRSVAHPRKIETYGHVVSVSDTSVRRTPVAVPPLNYGLFPYFVYDLVD